MSTLTFSSDEIREIVENFPSFSQKPVSLTLTLLPNDVNLRGNKDACLDGYVYVNDTSQPFKMEHIIGLSEAGYLSTRLCLVFRPTETAARKAWEKSMRNYRILEVESEGDIVCHDFDSEDTPILCEVPDIEWRYLRRQARINFRNFLLSVHAIDESEHVDLDTRPLPPEEYYKREKQTKFFPLEKWRLKDRYLKPTSENCDYFVDYVILEIGRTEDCGRLLSEKKQKEIPPVVILREEASSLTVSPSTRKAKKIYPRLTDSQSRCLILDYCGDLPESLKTNPEQWLTAKEVKDKTNGRVTVDSLRTMRHSCEGEKYEDNGTESRLKGILFRDESGRIAYTRTKKARVYYWKRTVDEAERDSFWNEHFDLTTGKIKRAKKTAKPS